MSETLKIFNKIFQNVNGFKAENVSDDIIAYNNFIASGTYTPASDVQSPTIDPGVDTDVLLVHLSPNSSSPLGNSKRVFYGGFWSKITNRRIFYMASNASGGSWTSINIGTEKIQPEGTAYNLNTDYLITGCTYQWYAWKLN